MNVYLYQNNTEKILKNAYIWEYMLPYTPTANTVFYYPLIDNQSDVTGNTTLSATLTKENIWYKITNTTCEVNWSNNKNLRFMSYWIYFNSTTSWSYNQIWVTVNWYLHFTITDSNSSHARTFAYVMWTNSNPFSDSWTHSSQKTVDTTKRHHFAYWIDSSNKYLFVMDWQSAWAGTASWTQFYTTTNQAKFCNQIWTN